MIQVYFIQIIVWNNNLVPKNSSTMEKISFFIFNDHNFSAKLRIEGYSK
ncbi:hypothetical protein LEP1GSC005_1011 [Leptospira santarosai str. ST188]|nr:hypothetical protein LEP1GSC005_1011 [Leptospira santarosai str. ST188]